MLRRSSVSFGEKGVSTECDRFPFTSEEGEGRDVESCKSLKYFRSAEKSQPHNWNNLASSTTFSSTPLRTPRKDITPISFNKCILDRSWIKSRGK